MAYKQDPLSGSFALAGWQVLEVDGIDAAAFLQAQLMNDVHALAPRHWQWNGWLNPKGRLIALLASIMLEENWYWLLLPDFPAAEFATRLQRFVFRSKLTMRVRDDIGAFADFEPALTDGESNANPSAFVGEPESGFALDFSTSHASRVLRMQPRNDDSDSTPFRISTSGPSVDTEAERHWRALDLAHGLPRLSVEQSEQWTPQMLSLDRLHAYSLKKGCYPGQEIVARTHYLGQAKRGLVHIAGEGFRVGAEIRVDQRVLGSVVNCIDLEALAVLSAERPDAGWECGDASCRELPLLDGLAR